jgi:hypothetical protein
LKGFEDHRGYVTTRRNNETSHESNFAIEFLKNLDDNKDNWYLIDQPAGTRDWYTDLTRKVERHQDSLGWWNITDSQHPNFVDQPGPSSQSAFDQPTLAPAPQITRTTSEPHEEFIAGALHHIATLQGTHPLTTKTLYPETTEVIVLAATQGTSIPVTAKMATLLD